MTTTVKNIWVAIALAAAVLAAAAAFPAAAVQTADTEVRIDNFAFAPQRTAVKAGTTVTWINEDDTPHTVVSSGKFFKSGVTTKFHAQYQFTPTKGNCSAASPVTAVTFKNTKPVTLTR